MSMPPALDEELSSPPSDISSPPSSPPQNVADSITVAARRPGEGVANPASASSAQPSAAQNAAAHNTNGTLPSTSADANTKPKRQRKPRESKDAKPAEPPKEKKTRKPREPKVKKEGDAATAPAPRKRQKTEEKATPAPADAPAASRQPTIQEMMSQNNQNPTPYQPASIPPPPRPQQPVPPESVLRSSLPPYTSAAPSPRPYSSGQNYDPIRGSTIDAAPPRPPTTTATNGSLSAQASPHINRASASPSITSLIDHPVTAKTTMPSLLSQSMQTNLSQQPQPPQHQQPPPFINSHHSPTPPRVVQHSPPPNILHSQHSPTVAASRPLPVTMDGAMDIDQPAVEAPATKPPPEIKAPSKASSSAAPTPKPAAAKASSPPKATGSGLLSSSDLFGGGSSNTGSERKGIDIDIRISLNPLGGNTINMAQEIAKKYGRDAVNPRAAAHRERLLQVAAAANRLDGGSADDMSVDLMSEADGDSNVEMGGVEEEKSATGADEKPKKRRRKVEEYDKEDDFIDDTELAWQQHAAVTKDGFFVYSGPLVPAGQTAQVEGPTTRGRGSGRGRGRGRAAAAAANGVTHASLAAEKKEAGTGRGRGRGRGTGAPRKPRITKADRERMEAEKADRERAAAQALNAPPPQPSGQMLAPSPANSYTASSHGPPQQHSYQTPATANGGLPA